MKHSFYSLRKGLNPNKDGLPLSDVKELFLRVYTQLCKDGYFVENFGFYCVDDGDVPGKVVDPELEILLSIRKRHLWPIELWIVHYQEDDFFDIIEFLYQYISKPIDGTFHSWNNCGMHWETFNKSEGQVLFISKINEILSHYDKPYLLSANGEILEKPEKGFEPIFNEDIPSTDINIRDRINSAILAFRRYGSTIDDRRQAVRDLADVLEYLRPKAKEFISTADENDLFNIANNFGIRHHNEKQKTNYDANIWLSWMFYLYLSTIHVVLRKIDSKT